MTVSRSAIIGPDVAAYIRNTAVQALQTAFESKIAPAEFFQIANLVVQVLGAVESAVALSTVLDLLDAEAPTEKMAAGLAEAAAVATTDAKQFFKNIVDRTRLVQITMLERTIN